jgi:catechol 2,3-dioxygenase-like lactoylglutathione lyase family enzyme
LKKKAMAGRLHVHLCVANLDLSREFYERFLGVAPVKRKADLVKFVPAFAPINVDPDGVEWEVYHVNYDTAEKHGGAVEASDCQPPADATG